MKKLESLYHIMEQKEVDALLISDPYNMRNVSGFTGGTGYVYVSRNLHTILTDSRYTIAAQEESNGFDVVELSHSYEDLIVSFLRQDDVKRLGIESNHVSYEQVKKWKEQFLMCGVQEYVSIGAKLKKLREIKEDWELERLRKAEAIGDIAFSKILDVIKPGITELDIAAELEYCMKKSGAQNLSFDTIVASGIHSSMPHAVPTNKKVELGDFITMDFGCIYEGYCSDMTRTVVVGKASAEQKKIYDTVLQAQLSALEVIKEGCIGKEVDRVARDIINQAGYEGCFGHGLGHSVGLEIHESPRLSMKSEDIILANTIETVEPGIYIKDFGGVRIEDMVVVTKDGHENFTKSEKRLIEL